MNHAVKRSLLRWSHLVFSIPIVGYLYSDPSQVRQYAPVGRYVFFPILLLSGLWMYAGVVFAVIGVAAWLSAFRLSGFGAALLSQVVLFVGRRIWQVVRSRDPKRSHAALGT